MLKIDWAGMTAKQREPYERQAKADAERYQRQMLEWNAKRVKRPVNAFMLFTQQFMSTKALNYDCVTDAINAAAKEWANKTDGQKAPWKKLAGDLSKACSAEKPPATSAKPGLVLRAVAKPKPKAAARKPSVKSAKIRVAATRKAPKTIKQIKPASRKNK